MSHTDSKWFREFFERFGADKIWVTPSKENVETVLEMWEFLCKVEKQAEERVIKDMYKLLSPNKKYDSEEGKVIRDFLDYATKNKYPLT